MKDDYIDLYDEQVFKEYLIEGRKYRLRVDSEWSNDESQITATFVGRVAKGADYIEDWYEVSWRRGVWPTELAMKQLLTEAGLTTLSGVEALRLRVETLQSQLKDGEQQIVWRTATLANRKAEIATAVQRAEKAVALAEEDLARTEEKQHRLRVELDALTLELTIAGG